MSTDKNRKRRVSILFNAFLLVSSAAVAGDFDWIKDFNIKAESDPSGFRARFASSFKIGNAGAKTVIGNVEKPADAYMVLRFGEMSNLRSELFTT